MKPAADPRSAGRCARPGAARKAFGATTRAPRVSSFEVGPGEVHALIGENGAGKSTLMKVLSGAYTPDPGTGSRRQAFRRDPLHARRCGIAMIYQELDLAPHLSVEENILLGREPSRLGWLNRAGAGNSPERCPGRTASRDHSTGRPGPRCSIAEQQVVEIARALVGDPKVIIMDEPTSSLTQVDTENLFAVIARLRQRGVSVIYISHFLEECQRICDRYTVLRDGESVGTGEMASATFREIIRLMVGREIQEIYPRMPHASGRPSLSSENWRGRQSRVPSASRSDEGEIFGIAGLVGAGRTETLRAVFGLDPIRGGSRGRWQRARTPTPGLEPAGAGHRIAQREPEGRRTDAEPQPGGQPHDHSLRSGFALWLHQQPAPARNHPPMDGANWTSAPLARPSQSRSSREATSRRSRSAVCCTTTPRSFCWMSRRAASTSAEGADLPMDGPTWRRRAKPILFVSSYFRSCWACATPSA